LEVEATASIPAQTEWNSQQLLFRVEMILRAFNHAFPTITSASQNIPIFEALNIGPGGKLRKATLRSAKIGRAHRREEFAWKFLRRERNRHSQNSTVDAFPSENAPERLALPAIFHHWRRKWYSQPPNAPHSPWRIHLRGRKLRHIRLQIAIKEVEN